MKLITLTPHHDHHNLHQEFQTILSNWKLVNTRQAMAIENKLKHTSIANIIHRGVYEIFCNTLILLIPCDTNATISVNCKAMQDIHFFNTGFILNTVFYFKNEKRYKIPGI